jgi:hypothetical protein
VGIVGRRWNTATRSDSRAEEGSTGGGRAVGPGVGEVGWCAAVVVTRKLLTTRLMRTAANDGDGDDGLVGTEEVSAALAADRTVFISSSRYHAGGRPSRAISGQKQMLVRRKDCGTMSPITSFPGKQH